MACGSDGWQWTGVGANDPDLVYNPLTRQIDSTFGSCTLRNVRIGASNEIPVYYGDE